MGEPQIVFREGAFADSVAVDLTAILLSTRAGERGACNHGQTQGDCKAPRPRSTRPISSWAISTEMIEDARLRVAETANSMLTVLHWSVGSRIRQNVQKVRAEYGQEILPSTVGRIDVALWKRFQHQNLGRMIQFAEAFPDEQIVATLSQQLSWSHFVELIPLKQPLQQVLRPGPQRSSPRSL